MTFRLFSRFLAIGMAMTAAAAADGTEIPGVGWEGQGADVVILQLDRNPRPDIILMAYDNPAQANSFRYRVGFNLNTAGNATSWLNNAVEVPGVGWEGQGAGAAAVDLDGNGRPELVLMAYDNPAQGNGFRYKIGWNLNAQGRTAIWTSHAQVPGVGWEGQGAAVVIGRIDADPRPDMIFVAYDNPAQANSFRYRVGFNLDAQGNATWATNHVEVSGVGWESQGAGAALANLDDNPRPDLVLMAYDNPAQGNSFRYRIGWNLDAGGVAFPWQPGFTTEPGVGWEGQGAGLALACLDGNPRTDWILMAYDNPSGGNTFRYNMLPNRSRAPCPRPIGSLATMPPRKSITQLTAQEVESLRRGFAQMRAWNTAPHGSANYRRSLQYWANMHSYMGGGCAATAGLSLPGMSGLSAQNMSTSFPDELATWCKCQHGSSSGNNLQFLTWHRMYLYYFEQVLQQAAGDASLRLPFFDYETNGQLPLAYRDGTMATNPLRVDNRLAALNTGGSSLAASVTSTSAAMANTSYAPFNQSLEQTPHGAVHCAIGVNNCPSGYMGYVPSAGNDPIFYSHHANIDRLYECWLRVSPGTRLPSNPSQLNATFTFIDGNGNPVTRRVGDMLTTAALDYTYAGGGGCPPPGPGRPRSSTLAAQAASTFQLLGETRLQRGTTLVPLRIAPEMRSLIARLSPAGGSRSMLVIEGLTFDEPPHVLYEVYLQRLGGRRALVGVINFFNQTSPHVGHDQGAASNDVALDATQALAALGGAGDATLVFEPATGLSDSTAAQAARRISERANVRFRAVRVEIAR